MENINNTIKGVKDLKYKLKVAYEEAKKEVDDNIARGFGGVIKEVCRLVNLYTIEL